MGLMEWLGLRSKPLLDYELRNELIKLRKEGLAVKYLWRRHKLLFAAARARRFRIGDSTVIKQGLKELREDIFKAQPYLNFRDYKKLKELLTGEWRKKLNKGIYQEVVGRIE